MRHQFILDRVLGGVNQEVHDCLGNCVLNILAYNIEVGYQQGF